MKNIFNLTEAEEMIGRINRLTPTTHPGWGKMNVSQMLAHCCVAYEMAFEDKHPRPNALIRFMLNLLVKGTVVGDKPYRKNSRTGPQFIIDDQRDFEKEKARLIAYMRKTQELGENHFEGKASLSFGPLTSKEWNVMFAKHLEHHLSQFGV
jgi:Protein of unknown function (DUF1569)